MQTQNRDLTVDAVADRIGGIGLLPVIVVDDLAQARPLARALVDSGLHTTDIHRVTEAGLDVLKFFPAEASGGAAAIAALAAPFPDVRFIPTCGVGPRNLAGYLSLGAVCCVGGSWMVPGDALRAGDWRRVTELCREAVEQVAHLRGSGS
jgi:2-dehydro-3-deoxyphosphogluconate aldolase/(4S)-4-hydroxy-2-oxoglutarate aldolase